VPRVAIPVARVAEPDDDLQETSVSAARGRGSCRGHAKRRLERVTRDAVDRPDRGSEPSRPMVVGPAGLGLTRRIRRRRKRFRPFFCCEIVGRIRTFSEAFRAPRGASKSSDEFGLSGGMPRSSRCFEIVGRWRTSKQVGRFL
jgi:hypothetical protein